jgi:hypothetical protein
MLQCTDVTSSSNELFRDDRIHMFRDGSMSLAGRKLDEKEHSSTPCLKINVTVSFHQLIRDGHMSYLDTDVERGEPVF